MDDGFKCSHYIISIILFLDVYPLIIFTFFLRCLDRNFSSSLFALPSSAGFFRNTFDILPSISFWISCLPELGWTLMFSFI